MISNNIIKRGSYGLLFMILMWFCTSFSNISFHILYIVIFVICIKEMFHITKDKNRILGSIYVLIPMIIIHLFDYNNGYNNSLLLFIYILTWTFDTFAYIIGIKIGKHKIFPSISPNKSWEGFFGGWSFTIIACFVTIEFTELTTILKNINLYLIAIIIPFTATLGDFIESYFKRQAGVKDSGTFIPGHGGMLDRIDALMITIPVIYIYIKLI
ncbi:MAG: phosphatidate cytidylyltransferase [Flavobacteriales bacterium]|jgi:phosphatidate cytidylyltransferase|nr:phosphatidate cytidylyltransferase [Flavobacteriales bacterium]